MNVFVTVGTTRFDALVQACDQLAATSEHEFVVQHANPDLMLNHARGQVFFDDVAERYAAADVVITHAGAGSIFRLLEMGKTIIVVPNFERIDKHQSDIARYVEENQYALVCWAPEALAVMLRKAASFVPARYAKEDFFKFEEMAQIIQSL
ncbi:PssE/Cps14G family polysaccharide biosynthesis glycosyltransferase [Ferrimonas balearica]|uniref:PssE/Cps14G family polysaccharide biosynthesis glycosyltransferase n=1 Tax=Ferrimonas balearica TaxID=44012 RepID=UPI001C95A0C1|nr:PssE/Cps14G family polysaccharide biosynthesis glycosyltransferase [Ferrimonas balearica]MBY5978958.1 hypothetical protein [Ferrimonas balearica]